MALTVRREELEALRGAWAALLERVAEPVPFIHPSWQSVWLEEFVEGREALFLAARDGDALVGVAPLLREDARLSFVGHYSICDYMDFVLAEGREQEALSALLDGLLGVEGWSELELRGLRDGGATLAALPELARAAGLAVEQEEEAVAPGIALPGSWDEYVASLGKKSRHELRRKIRRVHAAGEVEMRCYSSPAEVEEHLPVLLRLMTESRADKAAFMSERMGRFFHRMAAAMAEAGVLRIYELELDTKTVASVLCFDQGGQYYLYNSGYEPELSGLAVGIVSKALCLQEAIVAGRSRFDFLRGHEPYKHDLGGQDRQIYRLLIRRA